jgi:hypothetical protein
LSLIGGTHNSIRAANTKSYFEDGTVLSETKKDTVYENRAGGSAKPEIKISLGSAGYWEMVVIVFIMIMYVTMVYGPIAAFLVELFPTKIRYTSMSLPYHIGNGVFGGLTPFIATLLTTIYTGDKLVGLTYPILIGSICIVVSILYVNNKNILSFANG